MKTCPNCGELIGDSMEICFNCRYNFTLKRVISDQENYEIRQQKINNEKTIIEERKLIEEQKSIQLSKNPRFEYQTIIVNNLETGEINQEKIQHTLNTWSNNGWKLHTIFNNELGKTMSSVTIGFLGSSINATIDQTILIFERCIRA